MRWWSRTPLFASVLIGAAVLVGCGASGPGSHPVIDPDVGTASPTGCPPTFGQLQPANGPVSPPLTGPGTLGLPPDARQALVCFYGPLASTTPASLRWSKTLDATRTSALLTVVDAKPTDRTDVIGPINCPMDNGSAAILRFSYAAQPSQDVLVRMTGCQPASSEHGTTMFRNDIVRAVLALQ